MIFNEFYGAYYNCVAAILREAINRPLNSSDISVFVDKYAFKDSYQNINMSNLQNNWGLLDDSGKSMVKHVPTMPMTTLELRWLKAVMLDVRVQLLEANCNTILEELKDIEPLFMPEDIVVFDQYIDGDNYDDENYKQNFRDVLAAIHERRLIKVKYDSLKKKRSQIVLSPCKIEYSAKDDKFRLFANINGKTKVLRMSQIVKVDEAEGDYCPILSQVNESVTISIIDDQSGRSRNILERVMLQFSHYKKTATKTGDNIYEVTIEYDKGDETEVLIQLLSFGPFIKVTSPETFVDMMKERLQRQLECDKN